MFNKQTITVAELKSLLSIRFRDEQLTQKKIQARIQQELGNNASLEDPKNTAIKNNAMDWLSDLFAVRLKNNQSTTPLLSSDDLTQFISSLFGEFMNMEGGEFDAELFRVNEQFIKVVVGNIFHEMMVNERILPREDPYGEYWQWVAIVHDLADERGILPAEILTPEETDDEITRRMFSKEQYVALCERCNNKFSDVSMIKRTILQPLLDMVAEGNEAIRLELELELEAGIMPQLSKVAEKSEVVLNAWLEEEVARIYAVK